MSGNPFTLHPETDQLVKASIQMRKSRAAGGGWRTIPQKTEVSWERHHAISFATLGVILWVVHEGVCIVTEALGKFIEGREISRICHILLTIS